MADYTRIRLEADARGRLSINAVDDEGLGHGYRITGPKYIADIVEGRDTRKVVEHDLTDRDVEELHLYLRIWDEINAMPAEWIALARAQQHLRRVLNQIRRIRRRGEDESEWHLRQAGEARQALADACTAMAAAALAEPDAPSPAGLFQARPMDGSPLARHLTEQEGGPPNERYPDPTAPELAKEANR